MRAAFQLFCPPTCGIRDRTLGPWPKKLGRWAAAAEQAHRLRGEALDAQDNAGNVRGKPLTL